MKVVLHFLRLVGIFLLLVVVSQPLSSKGDDGMVPPLCSTKCANNLMIASGIFDSGLASGGAPLEAMAGFDGMTQLWSNVLPQAPSQGGTLAAPVPLGISPNMFVVPGTFAFLNNQAAFNLALYNATSMTIEPFPTGGPTIVTSSSGVGELSLAWSSKTIVAYGQLQQWILPSGLAAFPLENVALIDTETMEPSPFPMPFSETPLSVDISFDGNFLVAIRLLQQFETDPFVWCGHTNTGAWVYIPFPDAVSNCSLFFSDVSPFFFGNLIAITLTPPHGALPVACQDQMQGLWTFDPTLAAIKDNWVFHPFNLSFGSFNIMTANPSFLVASNTSCIFLIFSNFSTQIIGTAMIFDISPPSFSANQDTVVVSLPRGTFNGVAYSYLSSHYYSLAEGAWTLSLPPSSNFSSNLIRACLSSSGIFLGSVFGTIGSTIPILLPDMYQVNNASSPWLPIPTTVSLPGFIRNMIYDPFHNTLYFAGSFQFNNSMFNIMGWDFASCSPVPLAGGITFFANHSQNQIIQTLAFSNTSIFAGGFFMGTPTKDFNTLLAGVVQFDKLSNEWTQFCPFILETSAIIANVSQLVYYEGIVLMGGLFHPAYIAGSNLVAAFASDCSYLNLTGDLATMPGFFQPFGQVDTILVTPENGWLYVAAYDFIANRASLYRSTNWNLGTASWTQIITLSGEHNRIYTMASNSTSKAIWLGGNFTILGTLLANNVALMVDNGETQSFRPLTLGTSGVVYGLAYSANVNDTPGLIVTGAFTSAGGINCAGIATWRVPTQDWQAVRMDQLVHPSGILYAGAAFDIPGLDPAACTSPQADLGHWVVITVAVLVAVVVGFMVLLLVISARWYQNRKRRRYLELRNVFLDIPDDGKPLVSLAMLLNDKGIKKISWTDLEFTHDKALGRGASGKVLAARWSGLDVAIKQLHLADNEVDMAEFLREIKLLSSLDHPNVLSFFGVAVHLDTQALEVGLVTELMARGGLDRVIRKLGPGMSLSMKLRILLDTALGMGYLHSCQPAIIHRDLKPSNILVNANFVGKIADLGLSTFRAKTSNRQMTMNVGTPVYTAPEVLASDTYTETCDVYSFGAVMIEVISCQAIYSQDEFTEMPTSTILFRVVHQNLRPPIPDMDPSIRQLISECFQEPRLRPRFSEIILRLERLLLAYPPPLFSSTFIPSSDSDYYSASSSSSSLSGSSNPRSS